MAQAPSFTVSRSGADSLGAAILATCPDCVIVTDGSGVISEWNPTAEKTFVCPRHEAVGSSVLEFLFADGDLAASAVNSTPTSAIATHATRSDGSIFPCRVTIVALRGDAKILYVRDLSSELDSPDEDTQRILATWLRKPAAARPDGKLGRGAPEGSRRLDILVIDDAPEIRDFMMSVLSLEDRFNVWTFSNGDDALAYLEAGTADLIFLDLELRGETGDQIARRIRAQELHREVPILALTGHRGSEYQQRSLASGCSDHLIKPISRVAILAAIERHLDHSTATASERRPCPEEATRFEIDPLIPNFLASRHQEVLRIPELVDANRLDEVRILGHRLKGSGTTFGFETISQLGERIEDAATAGSCDELRSLASQLDRYLEDAMNRSAPVPLEAV